MFLECINSWGVSEVFLASFFIHKQIIHQLPIIYCLFFVNVYDLGMSKAKQTVFNDSGQH